MDITNIKIFPIQNPKGKVVAMCSFSLQDKITFSGFSILNGDKGLWISTPSRKNPKTGKYASYVFFNDKTLKSLIDKTLITEYKKTNKDAPKNSPKSDNGEFLDDDDDISFP